MWLELVLETLCGTGVVCLSTCAVLSERSTVTRFVRGRVAYDGRGWPLRRDDFGGDALYYLPPVRVVLIIFWLSLSATRLRRRPRCPRLFAPFPCGVGA